MSPIDVATARVRESLAVVQAHGPRASDRQLADATVAALAGLCRADVYAALTAAGIEGLKPYHSRKAMLRAAWLRITAAVRCMERQAV